MRGLNVLLSYIEITNNKESNRIIMKAILNQYGIDLRKNNYKLNNVVPNYNVFIHKNELDYK